MFAAGLGCCSLVLRSLLRFNPDVPHGHVRLCPMVPDRLLPIRLQNVPLAGTRMELSVGLDGSADAVNLPAGVRLVRSHPEHSSGRTV